MGGSRTPKSPGALELSGAVGAGCPVLGAEYCHGARCPLPGVRCPLPGSQCPVPCAVPVPCSRFPVPVPGSRFPVSGSRCPVPARRCLQRALTARSCRARGTGWHRGTNSCQTCGTDPSQPPGTDPSPPHSSPGSPGSFSRPLEAAVPSPSPSQTSQERSLRPLLVAGPSSVPRCHFPVSPLWQPRVLGAPRAPPGTVGSWDGCFEPTDLGF